MNEFQIPALTQLVYQFPLYLVCAADMVFALIFWRRGSLACLPC